MKETVGWSAFRIFWWTVEFVVGTKLEELNKIVKNINNIIQYCYKLTICIKQLLIWHVHFKKLIFRFAFDSKLIFWIDFK